MTSRDILLWVDADLAGDGRVRGVDSLGDEYEPALLGNLVFAG